jgi:hypothetical protein
MCGHHSAYQQINRGCDLAHSALGGFVPTVRKRQRPRGAHHGWEPDQSDLCGMRDFGRRLRLGAIQYTPIQPFFNAPSTLLVQLRWLHTRFANAVHGAVSSTRVGAVANSVVR